MVGSELRANGVAIGTFTGGNGLTPFVISFSTNMARIQAALGLIGFSSTSNAPLTTSRVISVRLTDAASGASAVQNRTVGVIATNDAPVLSMNNTARVDYLQNSAAMVIVPNATFTDVDQGNYLGGSISVQVNSIDLPVNRIELSGNYSVNGTNQVLFNGTVIGTVTSDGVGGNLLTIDFNANATPVIVQGLIRSLTYRTVGATTGFPATFAVMVLDPAGATTTYKFVDILVI